MGENSKNLRLCYLNASRVKSPHGDLANVKLESPAAELGTLDGVLIDPAERRVCFYVVEKTGWFRSKRYVIPTDCPARVEPDRNAIRLDVHPDEVASYDDLRPDIREFSDDDMVEALFARDVA